MQGTAGSCCECELFKSIPAPIASTSLRRIVWLSCTIFIPHHLKTSKEFLWIDPSIDLAILPKCHCSNNMESLILPFLSSWFGTNLLRLDAATLIAQTCHINIFMRVTMDQLATLETGVNLSLRATSVAIALPPAPMVFAVSGTINVSH